VRRRYTRVILGEWGLAALADPAELIVSELVTNSVQASSDEDGRPRYGEVGLPVVHLRLASDHARVLVEVWDSVPGRGGRSRVALSITGARADPGAV
jgi:hypothetical protein